MQYVIIIVFVISAGDNFAWADGSTLTLSRWAPGEPRGGGDPTKMCGEMHAHDWPGLWAAFPCTDSRPRYYICKAPKRTVVFTHKSDNIEVTTHAVCNIACHITRGR